MIIKAPTTIKVDHLTKSFNADFGKSYSALARILSKLHIHNGKRVVINDVSFSAHQGEIVGVIGRNGSGKSTLLRLLAKIYVRTSGTIFTEGRVVYLSPTGVNLIQKLSMRDNIFYFGSILGMSQKDIRKLLPEIVEFSGLAEHIDSSVLHFSTGMVARLSFSLTYFCLKHTNPEIILLDEVFGSGADIDFETKAIEKMDELIKSGMTVLLVSHNLEIMEKYCHKIMWLEDGRVKLIGMPKDIIEAYKTYDK